MNSILKYSLFLALLFSFSITSCDSDSDESDDDQLQGIQLVTTRSNAEVEGIGVACNFGKIIKEHLDELDLDELKEILAEEGGEEFDESKFDEILDEIFGGLGNKTMYVIVAGEDFDIENKEDIEVAGETFSLTWFSDSEDAVPGTYEAKGAKINIENPEDLENGATVSEGDIQVVLSEINDEMMVGTFSGTVVSKDGVSETIEGAFNVERASCEE